MAEPQVATPAVSEPQGLAAKATPQRQSEESSGEYTYEESEVEASARIEVKKEAGDSRPELPRRRSGDSGLEGPPKKSRKEETSEETRKKRREDKPKDYSKGERRRAGRNSQKAGGAEDKGKERGDKPRRRKRKRGGKKHQRLARLAEDPFLRRPGSYLETSWRPVLIGMNFKKLRYCRNGGRRTSEEQRR